MTKRKEYEEYLNDLYDSYECMINTEHCWGGNDKTPEQQHRALILARKGLYGTVLRLHDPIAFTVGFNDWKIDKHSTL